MIEKLKTINPYDETEIDMDTNSVGGLVYENTPLIQKINELVDAVNGILAQQEQYATVYKEEVLPMLTPQNEKPADPYAEQRKWIGKLCRFWNFNDGAIDIGILKAIDHIKLTIPYINDIDCSFAYCEPVKPDDNIIYKGGDNDRT